MTYLLMALPAVGQLDPGPVNPDSAYRRDAGWDHRAFQESTVTFLEGAKRLNHPITPALLFEYATECRKDSIWMQGPWIEDKRGGMESMGYRVPKQPTFSGFIEWLRRRTERNQWTP